MKKLHALFTVILILASSLTVESSGQKLKGFIEAESTVNRIEFIGVKDDLIIFDVHLDAVQKGTYLCILDENGNELLTESIFTSSFIKRYKFINHSFSKLQFIVKGRREILNETFNLKYRLEEKLEVSKA